MKKSTNKSSRKWLWPTIISVSVVILGIATGVICWAIGKAQEDKESGVSKDKVVMIVTSRGGMCSDGPCDHKRYSLYEDGRFEDHENLTKTEVTRIKNIVSKSSFSTMSAPEDERQCDSYVDGEDVVLIFPTIYGDRQFVPCEMLSDKEYGSLVYADITYVLSLIVRNDSHYYDFHNSRLNYGPSIVY